MRHKEAMTRLLNKRLKLEIEIVEVKARGRADVLEHEYQAQVRSIRHAGGFRTLAADILFGFLLVGEGWGSGLEYASLKYVNEHVLSYMCPKFDFGNPDYLTSGAQYLLGIYVRLPAPLLQSTLQ